jgi:two-component system chemotaxis response regulator CheY
MTTDRPRRALIVDDSRFTRRVLRGMLERGGFECHEAGDALSGLEALGSERLFDVALIDWNMPGMSGLEMVKEIRAEESGHLKVMMVTSQCDTDAVLEALRAGVDEYLMKPFDGESLREKLALMGLEFA